VRQADEFFEIGINLSEAWRLVGITERALKRILRDREPPAILIPDQASKLFNLWLEPMLMEIRRAIASGEIPVKRSSLTKPKLGTRMMPARHCWAEDQAQETQRLAKAAKTANPFADILW
jgi:hypothetical protein